MRSMWAANFLSRFASFLEESGFDENQLTAAYNAALASVEHVNRLTPPDTSAKADGSIILHTEPENNNTEHSVKIEPSTPDSKVAQMFHKMYACSVIAVAVFDSTSLLNCPEIIAFALRNRVACVVSAVAVEELESWSLSTESDHHSRAVAAKTELFHQAKLYPDICAFESKVESDWPLFIPCFSGERVEYGTHSNAEKVMKTALYVWENFQSQNDDLSNKELILVTNDPAVASVAETFSLTCFASEAFATYLWDFSRGDDKTNRTGEYESSSSVESIWGDGSSPERRLGSRLPIQKTMLQLRSSHEIQSLRSQEINHCAADEPKDPSLEDERDCAKMRGTGLSAQPFCDETSKFIFMLQQSIDSALSMISSRVVGYEAKWTVVDRIYKFGRRFLDSGYILADLVPIVGLVESLYSSCIEPLGSGEKVNTSKLHSEILSTGQTSDCVKEITRLLHFLDSMEFELLSNRS